MRKFLVLTLLVGVLGGESAWAQGEEHYMRGRAAQAQQIVCSRFSKEAACVDWISELVAYRHMLNHSEKYVDHAYSRLPKQEVATMVSDSERQRQAFQELRVIAGEVARYWKGTGKLPLVPQE